MQSSIREKKLFGFISCENYKKNDKTYVNFFNALLELKSFYTFNGPNESECGYNYSILS